MNTELKQAMKGIKAATPEENQAATERGDREWLIEHNLPMVVSQVGKYIKKAPSSSYLIDDLISAGTIALVQGVDRLLQGGQENTERYLRAKINGAIKNTSDEEQGSGIMGREPVRVRRTKDEAPLARQNNVDRLPDTSPNYTELMDSFYAACEDEEDEVIIEMRVKGYKDEEIGRTLNLTQQQVNERRRQIEARYDDQN